jgi:hypothetical protein
MLNDYGRPVRRSRRRPWQRNPRVVLAGMVTAGAGLVFLGGNVYGGFNVGQSQHLTVHAGDTLWSIAAAHYPDGDVRDRVDRIISLNHLAGGSITPGEDLLLPAP